MIEANGLLDSLREVKTREEILQIKRALTIHKRLLKFLKRVIRPGMTEKKILSKLEGFIRAQGASFSFPPIITSGVNSCYPHAKISGRLLRPNDIILVDTGVNAFPAADAS